MWQARFDACHLRRLCTKQNHVFVKFTKANAFD